MHKSTKPTSTRGSSGYYALTRQSHAFGALSGSGVAHLITICLHSGLALSAPNGWRVLGTRWWTVGTVNIYLPVRSAGGYVVGMVSSTTLLSTWQNLLTYFRQRIKDATGAYTTGVPFR